MFVCRHYSQPSVSSNRKFIYFPFVKEEKKKDERKENAPSLHYTKRSNISVVYDCCIYAECVLEVRY